MRNNSRLLSSFLLAMMLVNFHGNLVLRAQNFAREAPPRQLNFLWTIFNVGRGILWSFAKILLAGFLLFVGAIVWLGGCGWQGAAGIFSSSDHKAARKLGSSMMGEAFEQLGDIKRVLWTDVNKDDLDFFKRNLAQDPRSLSQTTEPVLNEFDGLNLDEFNEKTPAEVIKANALATFTLGRQNLKEIIDLNKMFMAALTDNPSADQKAANEAQKQQQAVKVTKHRSDLYKLRMRRIVLCSIKQFTAKLEVDMDPSRLTGKEKTDYDTNLQQFKTGNEAQKKKAQEFLKKFEERFDFTNKATQEKSMSAFGEILIANGFKLNDAKSSYARALIAAALSKLSLKKLETNKPAQISPDILKNDDGTVENPEEVTGKIKEAGKLGLIDNTDKLALISNEDLTQEEIDKLANEEQKH